MSVFEQLLVGQGRLGVSVFAAASVCLLLHVMEILGICCCVTSVCIVDMCVHRVHVYGVHECMWTTFT